MARPEVSVVIPTLGRETRLAFTLEAVAAQTLAPSRFEVIVARAYGAGRALVSAPDGLDIRFLSSPVASASAQRNQAWRAARAPLIAFTDDDCRPSPAWLERIADAAAQPRVFVQGRTEPDPAEAHLLVGSAISQAILAASDWYETCNMAYPKALLEELGGFDERFVYGGEDTDLGLRALAAGASRKFAPQALVWHAVHPRPLWRVLNDAPPRPTVPLLFVRHPRQRRVLYMGLFWKRSHARLTLGLVAAPLLGTRRMILGFLPYLLPEVRAGLKDGLPTWKAPLRLLANLGERTLIDLAAVLTSFRRSSKHKTLVL